MDIGRAFTYFSEDVNWVKKVLIGGVVTLIPIVNFAATGYWLTQTKNVYEGHELPLPEWDSFGDYFVKGLIAVVGEFIYSLPAILLYCCAFIVPASLLGTNRQGESQASPAASLLVFCGACLLLLYGLALVVFLPALLTRYAITGEFSALFQFAPAMQLIQFNVSNYIIAVLLFLVANFIAGFGFIACLIGIVFTTFWSTLVAAYLFGNVARGAPAPTSMAPMAPPPMAPTAPAQ
jgi:uncharacterized protein DUF4013